MGKISFILPVYNCEKYIGPCIENLLDFRRSEKEILLVDDGSRDGSGLICDRFASEYDFIKVIHQTNSGVSAARNTGLSCASGEYVSFIDADDMVDTGKLERIFGIMQSDEEIDMAIYGLSFDYYYSGKKYRREELLPDLSGKVRKDEWLKEMSALYQKNSLAPVWNKIIRRDVLINNNIVFKENMFLYEDMEFSLRTMNCCDSILFSRESVYHYRVPEEQNNAGNRLRRIRHLNRLVDQIGSALTELMESYKDGRARNETNRIIASLYLTLAREKIAAAVDIRTVREVCEDFQQWLRGKEVGLSSNDEKFAAHLLNRDICYLLFNRTCISVRHKLAVRVKSTGFYQKLKE